jgi:TRAP-type mannitol/chloroaromatic compound transport system substrate-binding protein
MRNIKSVIDFMLKEKRKIKSKKIFSIILIVGLSGFLVASGYAADEVFNWRAQTYAVPGSVGFKAAEVALDDLKKLTNGRISIKLYGVGTLVGAFEQLDAQTKGILECGFNAPSYYAGKDPAFASLFSLIGVWNNTSQVRVWMYHFGGIEIAEELYSKYDVKYIGPAMISAEPIMSKKPLKSLADFKGLKIRTPGGLTTMLFERLGAAPVALAGGELYSGLDTGVVDAAEFVTLAENWDIGLHEVTKYVLFPSFHGPIANCDFTVSKKAWNKLPEDLKQAMITWSYELDAKYDYMSVAESIVTLKKMTDYGLIHTKLSSEDMLRAKEISKEVANEWRKKSPIAERMIDSILEYLEKSE